jgi:hypothetical protein
MGCPRRRRPARRREGVVRVRGVRDARSLVVGDGEGACSDWLPRVLASRCGPVRRPRPAAAADRRTAGRRRILGGGRCRTRMSSSCVRATRRGSVATSTRSMRCHGSVWTRNSISIPSGTAEFQGLRGDAGVDLGHARGLGELRPGGAGDRRPGGERSGRGARSGPRRRQRRAGFPRVVSRVDVPGQQGGASTLVHIQGGSPRGGTGDDIAEPGPLGSFFRRSEMRDGSCSEQTSRASRHASETAIVQQAFRSLTLRAGGHACR